MSPKEKLSPEISLPFYRNLENYTVIPPTFAFYVKSLFMKVIWLSILLRFVDAVTDVTLSTQYLSKWDIFLQNFPNKSICQNMDNISDCYSNYNITKEWCKTSCYFHEVNPKIPLPGILSILILGKFHMK